MNDQIHTKSKCIPDAFLPPPTLHYLSHSTPWLKSPRLITAPTAVSGCFALRQCFTLPLREGSRRRVLCGQVTPTMSSDALAHPAGPLRIVDVSWKVDVIVSTSALHAPRANGTVVIAVQLVLSNGSILRYRLSPEALHQWRYAVARAARDLALLHRKAPPAAAKRHAPREAPPAAPATAASASGR